MKPCRVLVVDDEPQIRRLLRIACESADYRVDEATDGREGLALAASNRPDAVILDLGLPELPGIDVLRRLREWSEVPVLILSARQDPEDKVAALDEGADDYVTKPFDTNELLARLRVLLRRKHGEEEPIFENGPLRIDFVRRLVHVRDREVELTATEYALLRILARHAGKVITHRQLLEEVWGPGQTEQSQYLRVYLSHIRRKLKEAGLSLSIRTEPGIGYRLLDNLCPS
ncbi:MAG TPA: response regulator transcription factor [Chthoniobacterales bacterium]